MQFRRARAFVAITALAALGLACAGAEPIEERHRLWDFSPASPANPDLVRVTACNIEIPVSEFRAYISSYAPPGHDDLRLTADEKRRELQKLLDDHFWIWAGYQGKGDQSPDILPLLKITELDAMKLVLVEQESGVEFTNMEDYSAGERKVAKKLFDKTEIRISPEGYALLLTGAKRIDDAERAAKAAPAPNATTQPDDATATTAPALQDSLTDSQRELPVATWKGGSVKLGAVLQAYVQIPLADRPDLANHAVFDNILQEALSDDLIATEVRDRHLETNEKVLSRVEMDRDGLVRQWALEQITKKVDALMTAGGEAKLREWYAAHLTTLYTTKDQTGKTIVLPFDANHEMIAGDCFNDLQETMRAQEMQRLRAGKQIEINEKVLDATEYRWPSP